MCIKKGLLLMGMLVLVLSLSVFVNAATGSYNVTVTGTALGLSTESIGGVEGCMGFNVNDLVDLGFTNYRIYLGMSRLEPTNDNPTFGVPSIANIKANVNAINWAAYDQQLTRQDGYFWSGTSGSVQVSLFQILTDLKNRGIKAVCTIRPVDNNDWPAWSNPGVNPPNTTAGQNEWWEHVFATAYLLNVRNNLNVDDYQCHNEPDNSGQGWAGAEADYMNLFDLMYDALNYCYTTYLPGRTFRLYGPVSTHCNNWISDLLIQKDAKLDVVDWHRYGPPASEATTINGWIDQYHTTPGRPRQKLCLSEWGSYRGAYTSTGSGLNYIGYMMDMATPGPTHVDISEIFPVYDWTTMMIGLVAPGGTKRDNYYAFRMASRGLNNSKTVYQINHNIPGMVSMRVFAAKDPTANKMYVEILNQSAGSQTITLDLSAFAATGTVTYREYSSVNLDMVIGTGNLVGGKVTFTVPKNSCTQVIL